MTYLGPRCCILASVVVLAAACVGSGASVNPPAAMGSTTGSSSEETEAITSTDDTGAPGSSGVGETSTSGAQGCADNPTLSARLAELVEPHVDPQGTPGSAIGLVVGVANLEQRWTIGFGSRALGGTEVPQGDDLFEIGSLTKVYTGYLLAQAVERGDADLDDTLEATFGAATPTYRGQAITLLDLATHTSALPNYPDNLPNPGPINPGAGYTLDMLETFLAGHVLTAAPGEAYEYSNLGSGIAGHILVTAAQLPDYESLVQRGITDPLRLPDTVVVLNADQDARRVSGHAGGRVAPQLDIGAPLQGGGVLRSTAEDVLSFFAGALDGDDPTWATVMVPRRPSPNGPNAFTGLFLNVEDPDGAPVYSKSGGTPGFSSQVVVTLDPPAVVVLLSNANSTQGLYGLGKAIADAIEGC